MTKKQECKQAWQKENHSLAVIIKIQENLLVNKILGFNFNTKGIEKTYKNIITNIEKKAANYFNCEVV